MCKLAPEASLPHCLLWQAAGVQLGLLHAAQLHSMKRFRPSWSLLSVMLTHSGTDCTLGRPVWCWACLQSFRCMPGIWSRPP